MKPSLFTVADGVISPPPCRMMECQACPSRLKARAPVRGGGNISTARVVIVGETPTEEEDRAGKAFAGDAGAELRSWFQPLGLLESDVYLTLMSKCRAEKTTAKDMGTCRDLWFVRELAFLKDVVAIIPLGSVAKSAILPLKGGIAIAEASKATVLDPLGRTLSVFPLPRPSYYARFREEKPYLLRVVFPEVRAALVELGVARAT